MSQVALTAGTATKRGKRHANASGATWGSPTTYLVATVLIAVCIAPVLYIIIGGFRTNAQITIDASGWPKPWVIGNYTQVLSSPVFWQEFGNSLISEVSTTVSAVGLALMLSFVTARYKFAGLNAMSSLFAVGLLFRPTVAISPLYLLIKNLGLTTN